MKRRSSSPYGQRSRCPLPSASRYHPRNSQPSYQNKIDRSTWRRSHDSSSRQSDYYLSNSKYKGSLPRSYQGRYSNERRSYNRLKRVHPESESISSRHCRSPSVKRSRKDRHSLRYTRSRNRSCRTGSCRSRSCRSRSCRSRSCRSRSCRSRSCRSRSCRSRSCRSRSCRSRSRSSRTRSRSSRTRSRSSRTRSRSSRTRSRSSRTRSSRSRSSRSISSISSCGDDYKSIKLEDSSSVHSLSSISDSCSDDQQNLDILRNNALNTMKDFKFNLELEDGEIIDIPKKKTSVFDDKTESLNGVYCLSHLKVDGIKSNIIGESLAPAYNNLLTKNMEHYFVTKKKHSCCEMEKLLSKTKIDCKNLPQSTQGSSGYPSLLTCLKEEPQADGEEDESVMLQEKLDDLGIGISSRIKSYKKCKKAMQIYYNRALIHKLEIIKMTKIMEITQGRLEIVESNKKKTSGATTTISKPSSSAPTTISKPSSSATKAITSGATTTISKPSSGATTTISKPSSSATTTISKPSSGATKAITSGATTTSSKPSSGATTTISKPSSSAKTTISEPSFIATKAITSGAPTTISKPSSSATKAITSGATTTSSKPSSGATTTSSKPSSGATTTSSKPSSGATTTISKPSSSAKTTISEPSFSATKAITSGATTTISKPSFSATTTISKPSTSATTISEPSSGATKATTSLQPSSSATKTISKPSSSAPTTISKPSSSATTTILKPYSSAPTTISKPSSSATTTILKPSSSAPTTISKPSSSATKTISKPSSSAPKTNTSAAPKATTSGATKATSSSATKTTSKPSSSATKATTTGAITTISKPSTGAIKTISKSSTSAPTIISKPPSSAPTTISKPSSGATKTISRPSSGAPKATTSGATKTISKPSSSATTTISKPSSGATTTISKPSSGATTTISKPSSGATKTISKSSTSAPRTISKPSSGATTTISKPSSGATKTISKPSSGATKTISKPSSSATTISKPSSSAPTTISKPSSGATKTISKPSSSAPKATTSGATTTISKPSCGAPKTISRPSSSAPKATTSGATTTISKPSCGAPKTISKPSSGAPKATTSGATTTSSKPSCGAPKTISSRHVSRYRKVNSKNDNYEDRKKKTETPIVTEIVEKTQKVTKSSISLQKDLLDSLIKHIRSSLSHKYLPYSQDHLQVAEIFYGNPIFLSNWKLSYSEITSETHQSDSYPTEISYTSPLLSYRSYRLNSNIERSNLDVDSPFFNNFLHPHKIICSYDLTGICSNPTCKYQHISNSLHASPSQIYLDLLAYCPTMLKTSSDVPVRPNDPMDVKLAAAEATVKRLVKMDPSDVSNVSKICRKLIQLINRALNSKSVLMTPRDTGYLPQLADDVTTTNEVTADDDVTEVGPFVNFNHLTTNRLQVDDVTTERYLSRYYDNSDLIDENDDATMTKALEAQLHQHPDNVSLRFKLCRLYQSNNQIRQVLNLLCLGIELNQTDVELWKAYLPMFRRDQLSRGLINTSQLLQVVHECLTILPLVHTIWDEVLNWEWPLEDLLGLYDLLLSNLETHISDVKDVDRFYSRWLLCALMEKVHLLMVAKDATVANQVLQEKLSKLISARISCRGPLLQSQDLALICFASLHLHHCHQLPAGFYDDSITDLRFGLCVGEKVIKFPMTSSVRDNAGAIQNKLQYYISVCEEAGIDHELNLENRFSLLNAIVDMYAINHKWADIESLLFDELDKVIKRGDKLGRNAKELAAKCLETLISRCARSFNKEIFTKILKYFPRSPRITFIISRFYVSHVMMDWDSALQHLLTCVFNMIDQTRNVNLPALLNDDANNCSAVIESLIGFDLDSDIRTNHLRQTIIRPHPEIILEDFQYEKVYLWLCNCLLKTQFTNNREKSFESIQARYSIYISAIEDVATERERQILWTQYLLDLQMTGNQIGIVIKSEDYPTHKDSKMLSRIFWMRQFRVKLEQCLTSSRYKYQFKSSLYEGRHYNDYNFHNMIVDVLMKCYSDKWRSKVLNSMSELMPLNIPLLIRASNHLHQSRDQYLNASTLWNLIYKNRSIRCKNIEAWKIIINANYESRNSNEFINIMKNAASSVPRSIEIWQQILIFVFKKGSAALLDSLEAPIENLIGCNFNHIINKLLSKSSEALP